LKNSAQLNILTVANVECIDKILEGLSFLSSINADQGESLKSVDLFTSHEGLLLNYEESLTKSTGCKYHNKGYNYQDINRNFAINFNLALLFFSVE